MSESQLPTTKDAVLDALHAEFERWEALLVALNEAQLTAPQLDDGWSIKDVVAHLWAWQLRTRARLQAALSGRAPVYPDWPTQFDPEIAEQPHDLNAWLYGQSLAKPWAEVYLDWQTGFQEVVSQAAALDPATLSVTDHYPWLEGYPLIAVVQGTLEHHAEHAEFLAPVLAQLRSDKH